MQTLPFVLCVLALPFCALFIRPVVNLGIIDDWSYIRTAQVLADTGHLVYNGWATAMLGWQVYWGALLIKLFGFSYTVPRIGTMLIAVFTAGLMQRTFVRFGNTEWNSAAATLVFLLSPVYLPLTFSFMSDVYGGLALVGCSYCCLRALQTANERMAMAWVCIAALSNAVGGTARQIAWLGVLVMVPCTLWLLRKSRLVVLYGGLCNVLGVVCLISALHWFGEQPYSVPESLRPTQAVGLRAAVQSLAALSREIAGELLFLTLPLLLAFIPAIQWRRRVFGICGFALVVAVGSVGYILDKGSLSSGWAVPFMWQSLWISGFNYFHAYIGQLPVLLTPSVRLLLTTLTWVAGIGLFCTLLSTRKRRAALAMENLECGLDSYKLRMLLLPCTAAYLLLLLPRQLSGGILDRYLLFPEFTFLVLVLRVYHGSFKREFPAAIWLLLIAACVLNTAGMHDAFSLYSAQAELLQELTKAGVPRTAVDGGAQFNGLTQIVTSKALNDPRIKNPPHLYVPEPRISPEDVCHTEYLELTPTVRAEYVVSLLPDACHGPSSFLPIVFKTWYAPHIHRIYAVLGPYSPRRLLK